jgi:hypothetical protein
MSPAAYRQLRQTYDDVDKDAFDHVVGDYRNAEETLRKHRETGEDLVGAQIAANSAVREDQ